MKEGQSVLEIGSGWGGMGLYLAESSGVQVTGVTLSEEQFRISTNRALKRGMGDKVRFKLKDYRDLPKEPKFDRIVSVGMFEHIGPTHYKDYFGKVKQVLAKDGVMLLHSIGQPRRSMMTNPFIEKYIFPGAIFRHCLRFYRLLRRRVFSCATLKFCRCTMPKHCAIGVSALWLRRTRS